MNLSQTTLLLVSVALLSRAERPEPAWSHAELRDQPTLFANVHKEIATRYGEPVSGSFASIEAAKNSFVLWQKTKEPADGFRALYVFLATGESGSNPLPGFNAIWATLPADNYEVAWLHFLWECRDVGQFKLAPLGDRLLAKNGKDLEVLLVMSGLRAIIKPDQDLKAAE